MVDHHPDDLPFRKLFQDLPNIGGDWFRFAKFQSHHSHGLGMLQRSPGFATTHGPVCRCGAAIHDAAGVTVALPPGAAGPVDQYAIQRFRRPVENDRKKLVVSPMFNNFNTINENKICQIWLTCRNTRTVDRDDSTFFAHRHEKNPNRSVDSTKPSSRQDLLSSLHNGLQSPIKTHLLRRDFGGHKHLAGAGTWLT